MKATKPLILLTACLMATLACNETGGDKPGKIDDSITIASPTPTQQISKVSLTTQQQGYVDAGNRMAFRLLQKLYEGESIICSPLSLQYALAMTANGASGETLQEIIDFLGYGQDGIDALNAYSKLMLNQLPAVDLDVALKLTDALLVNADKYTLLPAFKQTVEGNYYAAAENMSFVSPEQIAARINDWAKRNTESFLDKVMDPQDISINSAAFLMNALYFKARWAGSDDDPMFLKDGTQDEKFTRTDGSTVQVPMMNTSGLFGYAQKDGYKVLALPYANGKFFMYFLLPDSKDPTQLLSLLPTLSWNDLTSSLTRNAEVFVRLPKFDLENKYELKPTLSALGIQKAFSPLEAVFDRMLNPYNGFYVGSVIQKAKISVAEWGTEAAAVTVVSIRDYAVAPGEYPKIYFYADHPFAFVIGEATSGAILFEGIYTGK